MIGNEDPYIKQAKNQTLYVSIQQIADELGGKVKWWEKVLTMDLSSSQERRILSRL